MNLKESIRRVLREDRYKGYKRFLKDNVFTDLPEYIINDMFRESGDLDYSQVQGMTKNQIIDYFFNGDGKKYFDRWGEYKGKKQKVVKIEWDDLTEPLQIFLKNKMSGKDPNLSDTRKKIDKMIEMEPNLGNGNNEPIQLKYNEKGKIEDITGGNHRTYAAFEINDFNPILMNAYIDDSKTTLQESIRRILMETVNGSTFFRRRVDISSIDEEFYKNLNIVTDRFLMLSSNKQSYSFNEFRTTVISYLIDDYRDNLSDEDYDNLPYDEVYDFLLNYFYDKIKDRYDTMFGDDLQESIRRILREERQLSNFLRRRLDMLDYEVERGLNGPFGGGNICLFFKSDIEYFESIMENSIDAMYYNHFSHIDDNSGEWAHAYLDMVDYIRKKYKSKIMKHYDDNCGSGLIPLKESIKRVLREDTDEYRENVRVKISDIQPTNRDGQSIEDAIINVKDGLTSYSQDPPFLLKRGDKYEILDGFHRIAQKILDGKKYVTSDVMIKESIRKVLREEKLHATPQELIKNLPKELKELLFKQWGAKQNPEWHPEGNTLKHIIVVIKRAYHHYPNDPNMVMAALFHDLGKIDTYKINPKTNQPTAYGHEDKSTDYVEKFKDWIESFEGMDVEEIKYLVKNHMKVKPSTWDQMKDKKKEPIMSHPAFDKLMGFTDKLDGGGTDLKESIRRVLKEETEGIDSFLDEISSKHNMSDELKDFVKQFIEESDCKRINFSGFKMPVMGLALESGVLINKMALNDTLPFLLFLIFHEVAHQYQFKKYGEDIMYNCYLGEISDTEAAEFMKHTEEIADDFGSRKIRQLQKLNLIGPYTPPQMYKNVPIQRIRYQIERSREDMRRKNIDSPKKVSEYFYNMVKSEL